MIRRCLTVSRHPVSQFHLFGTKLELGWHFVYLKRPQDSLGKTPSTLGFSPLQSVPVPWQCFARCWVKPASSEPSCPTWRPCSAGCMPLASPQGGQVPGFPLKIPFNHVSSPVAILASTADLCLCPQAWGPAICRAPPDGPERYRRLLGRGGGRQSRWG